TRRIHWPVVHDAAADRSRTAHRQSPLVAGISARDCHSLGCCLHHVAEGLGWTTQLAPSSMRGLLCLLLLDRRILGKDDPLARARLPVIQRRHIQAACDRCFGDRTAGALSLGTLRRPVSGAPALM